jgi:hypothetical protein
MVASCVFREAPSFSGESRHRSTTQPAESNPLNERQRICLQVIAEMDRENERRYGKEWNHAEKGEPPPPEAWRWLQYDPSHMVSEPELKRRLREVGIGGGGIKATMKALWARDCICIRHEQRGRYRVLSVQLTQNGRKLARRLNRQ